MFNRNKTFLFSLLIVSASHAVTIDENRLKEIAEDKGYGYKYANLSILKDVANEFNETKNGCPKIAIPEFFGLSSFAIQDFLKEQGLNVEDSWSMLVKQYYSNMSLDDLFKTMGFPVGFL